MWWFGKWRGSDELFRRTDGAMSVEGSGKVSSVIWSAHNCLTCPTHWSHTLVPHTGLWFHTSQVKSSSTKIINKYLHCKYVPALFVSLNCLNSAEEFTSREALDWDKNYWAAKRIKRFSTWSCAICSRYKLSSGLPRSLGNNTTDTNKSYRRFVVAAEKSSSSSFSVRDAIMTVYSVSSQHSGTRHFV